MRSHARKRQLAFLVLCASLAACGGSGADAAPAARWRHFRSLSGAVDVAGARHDARLVAVGHFHLFLLGRSGSLRPFARGAHGYAGARSGEPYLALSPERRLRRAGCSFHRDDVFVLQPGGAPAVVRVTARGRARRFAALPRGGFPDGIAFDRTGAFGHRLLVTATFGQTNALYAIDCRGHLRTVAARIPRVEGGMAVAPRSFGRFGGRAVAANERTGRIYAISARGRARLLVKPRLRFGPDIGVESLGFVPRRLARRDAYLADLGAPGSPTKGTNSILRVRGRALARAGVRPGDLLVATEAEARTIRVRCGARCSVRMVARGPSSTHAEGHVAFSKAR